MLNTTETEESGLPMLSPQTPSLLNPISFCIQYKSVRASSIVALPSNSKSLTHNNLDPDCKGGLLLP
jgi:hypothetical protein